MPILYWGLVLPALAVHHHSSHAYGESKSPVFTLKVKAKVDVPQTGDEAQLGLWLALMVLSLGGMAAMVMNCKRREN